MYRLTACFIAGLAVISLSCNSGNRARDIEGNWVGTPTPVLNDTISIDYIPIYDFAYTQGDKGEMTMTALISIERNIVTDPLMANDVNMTASAIVSVKGDYTLFNDKLTLSYNPSTLSVTLDRDATRLSFDNRYSPQTDEYRRLRDTCAMMLRRALPAIIGPAITADKHFTDLTMTDQILQLTPTPTQTSTQSSSNTAQPLTLRRTPD